MADAVIAGYLAAITYAISEMCGFDHVWPGTVLAFIIAMGVFEVNR